MIEVGLMGVASLISLGERNEVYSFFSELFMCKFNDKEVFEIKNLYKGYLDYDRSIIVIDILNKINSENFIISHKNILNDLIKILHRLSEQLLFFSKENNENGVIRMVIFNIPYCAVDQMQPLEFYDNLTNEDEPFWMRDVSDFIQK